jgi:membrane protease YdiL (CAAX protease family)
MALALPGLLAVVALGIPLVTGLGLRPSLADRAGRGGAAALWVASLGSFEVQYALWAPPPGYLEAFERLHEIAAAVERGRRLVLVAAIAIAPAVCEELVLRGMVLPSLLLGGPAAVVISAALFALIHLDPYRSAFTFALGLALGVLRLRSGSLLAPVLAHALVNTITFVAAPFTDDTSGGLARAVQSSAWRSWPWGRRSHPGAPSRARR